MKILIELPTWLGDTVMATPAIENLIKHYSDPEIAELILGVGLFMGMSKVLIALGLEPEQMDTTVLPTPGS